MPLTAAFDPKRTRGDRSRVILDEPLGVKADRHAH
jgi:hypothetical protein